MCIWKKSTEYDAILIKPKLAKHQMYFLFFAETLKSLCKEYSSLEKTETEKTTDDTQ